MYDISQAAEAPTISLYRFSYFTTFEWQLVKDRLQKRFVLICP